MTITIVGDDMAEQIQKNWRCYYNEQTYKQTTHLHP
jgi:hypothetical protein